MSEELKPCPFCGGEAKIYRQTYERTPEDTYEIMCEGCVASTCLHSGREFAARAWNTRAESEEVTKLRKMHADSVIEWTRAEGDLRTALEENESLRSNLRRVQQAALTGMAAAKEIGSSEFARGRQMLAESNPEVIDSERSANAILTEENERLLAANKQLLALAKLGRYFIDTVLCNEDWDAGEAQDYLEKIGLFESRRVTKETVCEVAGCECIPGDLCFMETDLAHLPEDAA